jgi:hypothetical protein
MGGLSYSSFSILLGELFSVEGFLFRDGSLGFGSPMGFRSDGCGFGFIFASMD